MAEAIGWGALAAGPPSRPVSPLERMRLWAGVAAICTLASGIGFAIADTASDTLQGAINGFAAAASLSGHS